MLCCISNAPRTRRRFVMFAGTTVLLVFRIIADCARLRIAMPTTLQRPFPDQYLLAYSADHVFYEVDHFFWLADVISRPTTIFSAQSPDAAVRTKNIFIEGFGLHLQIGRASCRERV